MHINVFIQKNLSLVIITVAFTKVYGFLHYLLRLICTSKKQNVDMSICEPPEWKGFLLCAPLFRTIFRDKKFPDVLTSRKNTNFLLLVEEFELIQQHNYHIIFQKKSETKISSNQCKKINDYMKDFLPSISDCRSLYRLGNLGIFQHVIWSLWIPSGVIGWRLQKIQ